VSGWPHRTLLEVPATDVARTLAQRVRERLLPDPYARCSLDRICQAGRFRYRVEELPPGRHRGEAMMLALASGDFLITVNPEAPGPIRDETTRRRRLRFRIAHEIGHSFFYDRSQRPARRVLPPSQQEEDFCQQFASALLVPPEPVKAYARDSASLIAIREKFDVSLNAAAWALVNSQSQLAIALLEWRDHPSRVGNKAMRVVWGAAHGHFLPPGASIRDSWFTCAQQAGANGAEIDDFALGNLRGRCQITVRPFGESRRALMFIEKRGAQPTGRGLRRSSAPREHPTQLHMM
jgi:IrrE N-terminal-like domain